MTTAPTTNEIVRRARARTIQAYARTAGILFLISFVVGGFGEAYVPSQLIVSADATATAKNIVASDSLFRMGFAGYLVEAICDVGLSLMLYVLLRPVRKNIALLAAFFGLMGTATFAAAELFYLAPALILGGASYLKTFSPEQLDTLALLSLKLFAYGGAMFTVFIGVAWVLRGYLIIRSGYLPKFLGILTTLGGLAFVTRNFLLVLAPTFASGSILLLILPGGVLLALWLLAKGIDVRKWEDKVATAANLA
jgi:uncharacterized protein DUF4386